VRDHPLAGRHLFVPNVGGDHRAVRPDAQLGAVRITDTYPLLEPERRLEPGNRGSHVGIDEDGRHRRRWRRSIRQHAANATGAMRPSLRRPIRREPRRRGSLTSVQRASSCSRCSSRSRGTCSSCPS
jgi:hypothetical protein